MNASVNRIFSARFLLEHQDDGGAGLVSNVIGLSHLLSSSNAGAGNAAHGEYAVEYPAIDRAEWSGVH
jgi:hypothetical protein